MYGIAYNYYNNCKFQRKLCTFNIPDALVIS